MAPRPADPVANDWQTLDPGDWKEIGPSFPKGKGAGSLPDMTNEDIKSFGRKALDYAPAVGATIGTILAPEGVLPAIGAAMLGGAAGSTVKQGTLAATGAKDAPQSWSEAAGNVAGDTAEQGALEAGGRMVSAPLEWLAGKVTPTRLYQSALRPGLSKKNLPKIDSEVATGLREGLPVSRAGADEATARIESINAEIANKIQAKSDELGKVIDPKKVSGKVDQLRPTFAQQVNPDADIAALNKAKSQFLDKHSESAPFTKVEPFYGGDPNAAAPNGFIPVGEGSTKTIQPMTLAEAQAEKQGTYRQLRGKYGELSSADTEAQKQLARGLKDEIVTAFPAINALNARDSALIDLEGQLLRFAGRHGNTNLMGIGTPIVAGAAGAAGGHALPAITAGIIKSAIDNPEIKSKLAIALYKASQTTAGKLAKNVGPYVIPTAARSVAATVDASQPMNVNRPGFGKLPDDTVASRLSRAILGGNQ